MPVWSSDYSLGPASTLTNPQGGIPGGANKYLMVSTDSGSLVIKTISTHIPANSYYEISGYIKLSAQTFNYAVGFALKKGVNSALDYYDNSSSWSNIVSFSNTAANGNYDTWTGYFGRFYTGANDTDVTFAISVSSDSAMVVNFDDFLVEKITPLPVEMISFNAEKSNNSVNLIWETASEINNKQFDIQRSIDGKSFETIGTLDGNGNSNTRIRYEYTDNSLISSAVVYYRLKQIDYNGKFAYSEIRKITSSNIASSSLGAYPNPFADNINWHFTLADGKSYILRLTNITGKLIYSQNIEGISSGTYSPEASLPHGMYILSIDGNDASTQRIKLIR